MVSRYAVVKDGIVANVIVLDEDLAETWFADDADRQLVLADGAGKGDTYADGIFTPVSRVLDYKLARAEEYPPLQDQLDMIFHDLEANDPTVTTWRDAIRAVKEKYPKGV